MPVPDIDSSLLPSGCHPQCKGCSHRMISKTESENQKYQWLAKMLHPWSEILEPVEGLEEKKRWGYRGKVKLSAQYKKNLWQFGMWKKQEFIPIPHCPVHKKSLNDIMKVLSGYIPPYLQFPLHYVHIAEKQVTLILKTKEIPDQDWFTDECRDQLAETRAESLWIHLNPSAGHRLFEKTPWIHLWGSRFSYDYKGFLYGPASFHQLIPSLYLHSLEKACHYLKPDEKSLVTDLYSGIGHSMWFWEDSDAKIIGIESSGEAVECAMKNIPGAIMLRGQCHHRLKQMDQVMQKNHYDNLKRLLYVNPPRTGLGTDVLTWITEKYKPLRMAYLSCSAGTLARDLDILCKSGYMISSIIPYDFFPNTYHIETLTLIEKVSGNQ